MSRENIENIENPSLRLSDTALQRYRAGTLEKGLRVIEVLDRAKQPLGVQEIAVATGLQRLAVFRLLCTLERRGYVLRLPDKKYRGAFSRKRIRFGYSAPLAGTPFRRDVAMSIQRAASEHRIELLMLNNTEDDPEANLSNVQVLVDAGVDLVLEFQPIESISHVLADRFSTARIPVIAIETPIPGGVFFGANNYKAGKMAGQVLANYAAERWHGKFDRLVLIDSSGMGAAPRARLTGTMDAIRELLGPFEESRIIRLDGQSHRDTSRAAMTAALQGLPKKERLLVSAFNDPTAVGALDAIRAAGRENTVAVVGQNATVEGREEIRKQGSPLIASIAYFPECYGDKIVRLGLSILNRQQVPLAVYTDHVILNRSNIDAYYPNPSDAHVASA